MGLHGPNDGMDRRRLRPAVRRVAGVSVLGWKVMFGAPQGRSSRSNPRLRQLGVRRLDRTPR